MGTVFCAKREVTITINRDQLPPRYQQRQIPTPGSIVFLLTPERYVTFRISCMGSTPHQRDIRRRIQPKRRNLHPTTRSLLPVRHGGPSRRCLGCNCTGAWHQYSALHARQQPGFKSREFFSIFLLARSYPVSQVLFPVLLTSFPDSWSSSRKIGNV